MNQILNNSWNKTRAAYAEWSVYLINTVNRMASFMTVLAIVHFSIGLIFGSVSSLIYGAILLPPVAKGIMMVTSGVIAGVVGGYHLAKDSAVALWTMLKNFVSGLQQRLQHTTTNHFSPSNGGGVTQQQSDVHHQVRRHWQDVQVGSSSQPQQETEVKHDTTTSSMYPSLDDLGQTTSTTTVSHQTGTNSPNVHTLSEYQHDEQTDQGYTYH